MGFILDRSSSTRSARSQGQATNPVAKYLSACLRLLQLVTAVVAIGYYASDIHKPSDQRSVKYGRTAWVYTVVVASMAAITALVLLILTFFLRFSGAVILFVWEWILVILFSAVTGLMCNKYFRHEPERTIGWHSMRVAAGFVCASLVLWFITAVTGTVKYLVGRRRAGVGFSGRRHSDV